MSTAVPVSVESATATLAGSSYEERSIAIPAAIAGRIKPVRSSPGYVAAAVLVAIVMLLLPVVYLAVIAAVGYATYLHAVHDVGILQTKVRGKGYILILMIYLGPIIAGTVMMLFLVKPLFARTEKIDRRRSLTRGGEPLLFDFIERLCTALGAPVPRRIDVDLEVNASASFRNGIWSMFGRDLVLTLGLPLVAGTTARQFSGVLAHEFGHFTQGAGMRLTYIIRAVSMWFARVVYERDAWDARLDGWCQSDSGWVVLAIGNLAKLGVWIGRTLLKGLMYVGHAVSGVLLRQMEYDADLHEIRFAGSDTFAATSHRLNFLGASLGAAYSDLREFYRDGKLGDDLSALVVANDRMMPDEVRRRIIEGIDQRKTGFFDTHPCDRERVERARCEQAPGVFHYDGPASDLFQNFASLSQAATLDLYRARFGRDFKPETVQSVAKLQASQQAEQEFYETTNRYFLGAYRNGIPPALAADFPAAPEDVATAVEVLRQLREQVVQERGTGPADTAETSDAFMLAASQRLTLGLRLLQSPATAAALPTADALRAELLRLYEPARLIYALTPDVVQISHMFQRFDTALHNFFANRQNESARQLAVRTMGEMERAISEVYSRTRHVPYPFDHAEAEIRVAGFLVKQLPDAEDVGQVHEAASRLLENFGSLASRLTGRLTKIAEQVEQAHGLGPLQPAVAPTGPLATVT